MKTVDRMGIHIDQCEGCRGIFLDRGELEQIVGAEQRYSTPAAPPPAYQPDPGYRGGHRDSPAPYRGGGYQDSPRPYRGGHGDSPPPYGHGGHGAHGQKRKRRSFLEELFD
jgi:uncharacterized protein